MKPMILHLTIKKFWFDKIASGEKTIEYREKKPHWDKRLCYKNGQTKIFDEIHFKNGYRKNSPLIRAEHKATCIIWGKKTDLKIDKSVFAILLGDIIEIRMGGNK